MLTISRGVPFLGPFVEMISRMLSGDIARFIIIYVIFILAMTQGTIIDHVRLNFGYCFKSFLDTNLRTILKSFLFSTN